MITDGRSSLSENNDTSKLAEKLVVVWFSTNSTDPSEEIERRRFFCAALFDGRVDPTISTSEPLSSSRSRTCLVDWEGADMRRVGFAWCLGRETCCFWKGTEFVDLDISKRSLRPWTRQTKRDTASYCLIRALLRNCWASVTSARACCTNFMCTGSTRGDLEGDRAGQAQHPPLESAWIIAEARSIRTASCVENGPTPMLKFAWEFE